MSQSRDSQPRKSFRLSVRLGRQQSSNVLQQSHTAAASPQQQQAAKNFVHKKPYRTHQSVLLQKFVLWSLTILGLVLSWAVGYFRWHWLVVVCLVVVMILVWSDINGRIVAATERDIEIRLRRKKTVQLSETAEWVNLALNRWWMSCSDSVLEFLKDYIEPLLQEIVPIGIESVEILELDLANQTPFVKTMKVSDGPSSLNPSGDHSSSRTTLVANLDVGILAPDSRIVLKARLGGKWLGYDTLVYVEGLHLSGTIQSVIQIDYEAPFPHVASMSSTFVRKPDIWYSVKVLKGLKVTEIPLVKSCIHSFVMSIFCSLLVDPGRLDINFLSGVPKNIADTDSSKRAHGVLTVTIRGNPPDTKSEYEGDSRRWCSIKLGSQKHQLRVPTGQEKWRATYSFLVYNLKTDTILIKIKHRRVMYTNTLATHTVELSTLNLPGGTAAAAAAAGDENKTTRSLYMNNNEASIGLDMEYTVLPPFSLNSPTSVRPTHQVAGVLYIHIHSASGLLGSDSDGLSDPYCVVEANKRKVLTTHYVLDTLEPKWERGVELFVADFSLVSLNFIVYDWDGPFVGDDFLGAAKLTLEKGKPQVLQQQLDLEIDGNTVRNGHPLGSITVSTVFRPVDSVSKAELPDVVTLPNISEHITLTGHSAKKAARKKVAKTLPAQLFTDDYGLLELSVKEGRNLLAMDRNGFSDPYIVVKYGNQEMYRTHHVNKTLNPQWNCQVTLSAPPPDVAMVIECWDKDQFTSDDFLGSFSISVDSLSAFQGGPQWCRLQNVKKGEILIEIKKTEPYQDSLSSGDISHLDEASRPLVHGASRESQSMSSSLNEDEAPMIRVSDSDLGRQNSDQGLVASSSDCGLVRRRASSTITPRGHHYRHSIDIAYLRRKDSNSLSGQSGTLSIPSEIGSDGANKRGAIGDRWSPERRSNTLDSRQPALFYFITGVVIEVEGLKGKLDHLELYVKVRMNCRPSYQRKQKFDRGPVVHRTRRMKGMSNLKWREDFAVKETTIPSDSFLTVDLKSSSKVTLGTHGVTLDKFFDGNMAAMRWLDIGNGMRVCLQLTRQQQPTPVPLS